MKEDLFQEGWANSLVRISRKTHYYKDGTSLCGYWKETKSLFGFEKRLGNKYFNDCGICIKKQKKVWDK